MIKENFVVILDVQNFPDHYNGRISDMPDYVLSVLDDMINDERRFRNHVRFVVTSAKVNPPNETKN